MLGPYKSILYILCVTYYILIFILFLWLVRPSDIKLTRAPYRCLASHKKLIFCHWRLIYNFRFWLLFVHVIVLLNLYIFCFVLPLFHNSWFTRALHDFGILARLMLISITLIFFSDWSHITCCQVVLFICNSIINFCKLIVENTSMKRGIKMLVDKIDVWLATCIKIKLFQYVKYRMELIELIDS